MTVFFLASARFGRNDRFLFGAGPDSDWVTVFYLVSAAAGDSVLLDLARIWGARAG
jgi:hypothetical protein